MTPRHNPHRGLDPLVEEVRRRNDPRLGIAFAWRFAEVVPTRLGPLRRIGEYVELTFRIWGQRRRKHILIREFSTYFIFLTLILVFPLRHKCLLLIAHNVQMAAHRPREAKLLKLLARLGVRFACLESDQGVRLLLGIDNAVVFPHPVISMPAPVIAPTDLPRRLLVGVAGDLRPEKGLDLVIPYLVEAFEDSPDVLFQLGTNRVTEAQSRWPRADIVDTTAPRDYLEFLRSLDVLVLSYPDDTYRYRVSGVIAEATGCGTAVICTDLPCLRMQVMSPATGGAVLEAEGFGTEALIETIHELAATRPQLKESLAANARARSPERVVDRILAQLSG